MSMPRTRERAVGFLFRADSDTWLALLRIGLGVQVVIYSLSLRSNWSVFFAGTGHNLTSRDLGETIVSLRSSLIPKLGWLIKLGYYADISEGTVLFLAWILLLAAGCCLLAGFFSRLAAIIAWFLHLCAAESAQLFPYGMDSFMTIALFYLMISPLPDRYSLDWRLPRLAKEKAHLSGFYRRVLQLHLCFIYFFGGVTKCLGSGWWDGSNMWRALTRPPLSNVSPDLLVRCQLILVIAGVMVCLIEIGYPVFIWWMKTRLVWLLAVLLMHAAIGLLMGLYLFAWIMIVLNLAAFGPGLFESVGATGGGARNQVDFPPGDH
jgi:uncharacterized membrane protein YphA (DoxX/SURF4 family)